MTPSMLVTLKLTKGDSKQVVFALKKATGKDIEFIPNDVFQKFDIDFKDTPLWDVLESISSYGKLKIAGINFEDLKKLHGMMLRDEKLSVCMHKVSVKALVSYLSFLSGSSFSVVSGNIELRISMSLREVSLDEIITKISTQTGVIIERIPKTTVTS